MSPFLSRAIVSQLPDGSWVLEQDLRYEGRDGFATTVPRGFVCDFASVPRLLWPLVAPTGRHARAASLHDFLYWEQTTTRQEADEHFRDAMLESGVLPLVAYALYWAVRAFGCMAWSKNARDKAAGIERFHRFEGEE